jgi:thioredoxin-dependent peroxiredoxin
MSIKVGDPAPDFSVQNELDETVTLQSLRGKPTVLFFYPKADTPGWTIEACGFRDAFTEIQQAGAAVYGVSADTVSKQKKFKDKYDLQYHLLADTDKKLCEAYGVLKEKSMYGKKYLGIDRMSFLISPDGKIARIFEQVKPDSHAQEVLEALSAL